MSDQRSRSASRFHSDQYEDATNVAIRRYRLSEQADNSIITDADQARITALLKRLLANGRVRRKYLSELADRARRARTVRSEEIPRNVVTMNSRVALKDLETRRRYFCTLVDPHDARSFGDRISIAAPPGIAILGKCVGEIVHWKMGARMRRFRIEQILYQPEAAGDYHL